MSTLPKPGIYKHFKGGLYEVIGIGRDHETHEELVSYRALYTGDFGDRSLWVRPLKNFTESVTVNGVTKPRFRYLGKRPSGRILWAIYSSTHFELIYWLMCAVLALGLLVVARDLDIPGLWFYRHPKVDLVVGALLSITLLFGAYARYIGPWRLVTNNFNVPLPGLTKALRIALIADIQVGDHKKDAWVKKIVARIIELKPDLVLIAGDLVSNELNPEDESVYLEPLAALTKVCPTYAVMGNHDFGVGYMQGGAIARTQDKSEFVRARFKKMNVPLLENDLVELNLHNQKVLLFGATDIWGGKQDFTPITTWDNKTPLLFLAHNPDALLEWPTNIPRPTLALAGHTHAGQVRLPFYGAVSDAQTILPKKHYYGINTYHGSLMFVTAGVGESLGPLRFGIPPEVAILNLTPESATKPN